MFCPVNLTTLEMLSGKTLRPYRARPSPRLTQHKRLVPDGTHPDPAFGGTSFMLGYMKYIA